MKAVLVTGAAGGIGQALCEAFSNEDYQVIATDKDLKEDTICNAFIQADLQELIRSPKQFDAFFTKIKEKTAGHGVTTLVNNAALQILGSIEKLTIDNFQQSLNVNLLAPFSLIQGLLPDLKKNKGSVVNIASVHSRQTKPGFVCYASSKAALVGLTHSLSVELGSRVRVNAINPAATMTPMLKEGFKSNPALLSVLANSHPIGRIAQALEIAQVAAFLASEKASFMTGAVIDVDGGILSRLHDPA